MTRAYKGSIKKLCYVGLVSLFHKRRPILRVGLDRAVLIADSLVDFNFVLINFLKNKRVDVRADPLCSSQFSKMMSMYDPLPIAVSMMLCRIYNGLISRRANFVSS